MSPTVEPAPSGPAPAPRSARSVVARNAAVLMAAQALGTPISMLTNAVMGRYLGAAEFGQFFLASTYAGFGFLFVEWGLGAVVPAEVAKNHARAGTILGSALLWRVPAAPVAAVALALIAFLLGEHASFQMTLSLFCLTTALSLIWRTCGDAVRGFERTDVAASSQVAGQLLTAALVVSTLLLGGRLHASMVARAAAAAIILIPVWRVLRTIGLRPLVVRAAETRRLRKEGTAFLTLGLVLALQPYVDALWLSRLAPDEVMGWHAAAKKLLEPLVYPASALIGALYPTLVRLYAEDKDDYVRTARSAIRACIAMVVPIAIGCFQYAEIGIRLFSKRSFAQAENNLQILAVFVLLVYVTMTIGTCLFAAGKQRAWTFVQFLCIVISALADPIAIRFFQGRYHNGGLGVALTTVASETLMLVVGIVLMPRGIFDRTILGATARALLAGGVMVGVARLLAALSPFLAAPIAVAAYAGALFAVGGIEKEQLAMLRSFVARKAARRR